MTSGRVSRLAVVGSINVDHVIRVPSLPAPGETVLGSSYAIHHGGKGANLAVAAARLGATVSLLGAVGTDEAGRTALAALVAAGIDTSAIERVNDVATGTALIVVDDAGENQIAVSRGANWQLDASAESELLERLDPDVVAAVLEIPMDAVLAAATFATRRQRPFVLSAAPGMWLPEELVSAHPIVCINAAELPLTLEQPTGDRATDARALLRRGARAVLVTLGAEGAELVTEAGAIHFRGTPIMDVVDSTGAGDTFAGALTAFLTAGEDLKGAARLANAAAGLSVRRAGARDGMPSLEELETYLAPA